MISGAAAYVSCVEDWQRNRPDFRGMGAQERSRIQSICEPKGMISGAAAYVSCVEDWQRNRPDFRGMGAQERSRIQSICEPKGMISGAAAYVSCVEDWQRNRPDFRGMGAQERSRIQSICEPKGMISGGGGVRELRGELDAESLLTTCDSDPGEPGAPTDLGGGGQRGCSGRGRPRGRDAGARAISRDPEPVFPSVG